MSSCTTTSRNVRRDKRFPFDKTIEVIPRNGTGGAARIVRLRDCSARGIGFDTSQRLEPGQLFVARVDLNELMMVLFTVRHCSVTSADTYHIGAELGGFVDLDESDADEVIASLMQHSLA